MSISNLGVEIEEKIVLTLKSLESDDLKSRIDGMAQVSRWCRDNNFRPGLFDLMITHDALPGITRCLNHDDPEFILETLSVLTMLSSEPDSKKSEKITFLIVRAGLLVQLRDIVDLYPDTSIGILIIKYIISSMTEICPCLILQLEFIEPIVCLAIEPFIQSDDRTDMALALEYLLEPAVQDKEYFRVYLDGVIRLFKYSIDFNDTDTLKRVASILSIIVQNVQWVPEKVSHIAQSRVISYVLHVLGKGKVRDDILHYFLVFVGYFLASHMRGTLVEDLITTQLLALLKQLMTSECETIRNLAGRCYSKFIGHPSGMDILHEKNLMPSFMDIICAKLNETSKIGYIVTIHHSLRSGTDEQVERMCNQVDLTSILCQLLSNSNWDTLMSYVFGSLDRIIQVQNTKLVAKHCNIIQKSGIIQ